MRCARSLAVPDDFKITVLPDGLGQSRAHHDGVVDQQHSFLRRNWGSAGLWTLLFNFRSLSGMGGHASWCERSRPGGGFRCVGNSELSHQIVQLQSHFCQQVGGFLRFLRTGRRASRRLRDAFDVAGDFRTAARRVADVAGHFVGGGALLLDRRRNRARNVANVADHAADVAYGVDGTLSVPV